MSGKTGELENLKGKIASLIAEEIKVREDSEFRLRK